MSKTEKIRPFYLVSRNSAHWGDQRISESEAKKEGYTVTLCKSTVADYDIFKEGRPVAWGYLNKKDQFARVKSLGYA